MADLDTIRAHLLSVAETYSERAREGTVVDTDNSLKITRSALSNYWLTFRQEDEPPDA